MAGTTSNRTSSVTSRQPTRIDPIVWPGVMRTALGLGVLVVGSLLFAAATGAKSKRAFTPAVGHGIAQTRVVRPAALDQTDLPTNFARRGALFSGMWGFTSVGGLAQTFVAGRTGNLVRVLLPVVGCNGIPAGTPNPTEMKPGCRPEVPAVRVVIAALGSGRLDGNVLAKASPVVPPVTYGSTSASAVMVSFDPAARVTKGKGYVIVVTALADWPPASYLWSHFQTNKYVHGRAFRHDGNLGWVPARSGIFAKNGPLDFGFATYVSSD